MNFTMTRSVMTPPLRPTGLVVGGDLWANSFMPNDSPIEIGVILRLPEQPARIAMLAECVLAAEDVEGSQNSQIVFTQRERS
jgi:hypothetical protein